MIELESAVLPGLHFLQAPAEAVDSLGGSFDLEGGPAFRNHKPAASGGMKTFEDCTQNVWYMSEADKIMPTKIIQMLGIRLPSALNLGQRKARYAPLCYLPERVEEAVGRKGMSKLYFDFDDGRSRFKDEEGIDLPDLEAARTEVLKTLGEIAKDALPKGDQQAFTASVRNTSGEIVYSAKVTISGGWYKPRCL